jgi:hypothetical protein
MRRRGHGGRPRRPRHPSRAHACPTATLHDLISVGHSGRWKARTPDAHTGHRTPDTGHVDAQTPAPDTGHVGQPPVGQTLDALTGHRRGQGDDSTAGVRTSRASSPSDRTLDAQPCSCSRTTKQLLGRSIGQTAPRRIALLGRLRVERRVARWRPSGIRRRNGMSSCGASR